MPKPVGSPARESVQRRLKRINLRILGLALLTIGVIVVSSVFVSLTYSMLESHQVRAKGLAEFVAPALLFDDRAASLKNLDSLRDSPAVASASIIGPLGEVIGQYRRADAPALAAADARSEPVHFTASALLLATPVLFDGTQLGVLHLRVGLHPVYRQTAVLGLTIMLASALAMTVVYFMLQRLQGTLVRPLQKLITVIDGVGSGQGYESRAARSEIAEIDTLSQRFNEMLALIQQRDERLASHRDELEAEVARRTAELPRKPPRAPAAPRASSSPP